MIHIGNKAAFIKLWYDKGITVLSDLLDANGNIFSPFFYFRKKYNIDCNFVKFYSLKTAIPTTWEKKCPKL